MTFDGKYLDWNHKKIKGILDHYGYQFMSNKKILDLGCGHGDIGGALYRLGADITAVDARQEHLNMVKKKFPGIKTIKADLDRNWPFHGKQFDLIIDLDLMCHLNNYESHIRDICSSASNIILETAVCDSNDPYKFILTNENKNIYDLSANGQSCKPSAAAIERMFVECGFSFKRMDNAKFNSNLLTYNWLSKNNDECNENKRRIWFAERKSNEVIKPLQVNNKSSITNSQQNLIVVKQTNNVKDFALSGKKLKTALCISGHLRTFEDNFKSVKDNILDLTDCDIFIHTWDNMGLSYRFTDANLHSIETKRIIDKIKQLYNPKKMIIEKTRHFLVTPIMQQRLVDHRDVQGILSMFYKIEACNKLKSQYEIDNNFKYDCVIRFRGDLRVETPFPNTSVSNLNSIYLPIYGNFGGACDQFAYGNSEIMDTYSSLFSNMEKYLFAGAPFNPEKLLLYHLEYNKLPITKVNFKYLIMRANGLIQDNMLLERALGFLR